MLGLLALLLSGPPTESVALVHASVFPMDRNVVLRDHTVLLKDGLIVGLESSSRPLPPDFKRVDCSKKFVIPGLVDSHSHVSDERILPSFLLHGVTTTLIMDGRPRHLDVRDKVRRGQVLGPDIIVASTAIDGTPLLFPDHLEVKSPEEASQVVERLADEGYDFIKVYNNVSAEQHRAIVSTAAKRSIRVIGHIPRSMRVEDVLANGQVMVAHSEEFFFTAFKGPRNLATEDVSAYEPDLYLVPRLASLVKSKGAYVTPNLNFLVSTADLMTKSPKVFDNPEISYLPSEIVEGFRSRDPKKRPDFERFRLREQIKARVLNRLVKEFDRVGVPLIAGTDSPIGGVIPGESIHAEIQELRKIGLTPYRALRAATATPGEFFLRYRPNLPRRGVVAVGAKADLLVLGDSPISAKGPMIPLAVVKDGKIWSRQRLIAIRNSVWKR